MGPKPGPNGALAIAMPMGEASLPGIAAEDIGRCAYGILREGTQHVGQTVGIAGEHLTGDEMAAGYGEVLGKEVAYVAMEPATYRGLGFPGAEDLGNMFQFKRDFNAEFCAARDLSVARRLNPQLQTFREWLAANKDAIPLD